MASSNIRLNLQKWVKAVAKESKLKVKPIELSASLEWEMISGTLLHRSGQFFRVVGCRWINNKKASFRPLIDQSEIGSLGFIISQSGDKTKILLQAKVEPGNVGGCQIAPSYQATSSNSLQAHGGKEPPLKKNFWPQAANPLSQSLNSEQGSRFFNKMNLNVVIKTSKVIRPGRQYRWVQLEDLLAQVTVNNLLNSDARSVLVTTSWRELLGREPFSKSSAIFARQLQLSYRAYDPNTVEQVLKRIDHLRERYVGPAITGLDEMPGWKITKFGVEPASNRDFRIKQIRVSVLGREVPSWDQPIIDSRGYGQVDLVCQNRYGLIRFLFQPQTEPGLLHGVELGPTRITEPGQAKAANFKYPSHTVIAKVYQSDEGGRFYKDTSQYRIVLLKDSAKLADQTGHWLTLGETSELLKRGGYFTNEARSALSLLLQWL